MSQESTFLSRVPTIPMGPFREICWKVLHIPGPLPESWVPFLAVGALLHAFKLPTQFGGPDALMGRWFSRLGERRVFGASRAPGKLGGCGGRWRQQTGN